jgi:hypothetical protein
MLDRLLAKLRGSSREPDDLALGTTRPGDFAEEPDVKPNPHDEEDERVEKGTPGQ